MWGIGRGSGFLVVFFVLTITFCLVSAGIFKANTTIGIAAYAKKSEESSGGSSGGDNSGSNSEGGGTSSDKGSDNTGGSSTGGDNNNPTIEEPPTPPPTEEPTPTPEPPTPPPPPVDCTKNPDDPSCKTTPGPIDCKANPSDPSCPPPPVDCTTNPTDPSCKQPSCDPATDTNCPPPPPVDCTKNPDDPSCKVDCTTNPTDPSCPPPPTCQSAVIGISCPPPPVCKSDEHLENGKCVKNGPGPDDDCLFNPSLSKCKATCDANNFCQCPKGFSMNEDDNCFPDKPCPKGFERHNEDETGKCFPITCPPGQHFDPKVNKCAPICPDGTGLLNGKCPTKTLSLSISVDKDPIIRGHEQTITVTVSDKDTHQKISGANVKITVGYATGFQHSCSGTTDGSGKAVCKWQISGNAKPGIFKVTATATKDGYKSASGSGSFKVISVEPHHGGSGGDHNVARPATVQQVKYFKEFSDMPPNSPLYITSTSMHKDTLNDIVITGEIKNRGTSTANFVELIATFYNVDNKTIGNENTFTKPSTLQPGQAAPFTMYLSPKDMPLSQIKSVKYHLSWKYAVASSSSSSPLPASKILRPNTK